MGNSIKRQKLEDKILMSLNSFLRNNTSDARLTKTSITKVELSPDNSMVKVFWDTYDPNLKTELATTMPSMSGRMRSHLASVLNIRHVPEVQVKYDTQFEDEQHIEQLLKQDTTQEE
jgi:ribosome-binding factor A